MTRTGLTAQIKLHPDPVGWPGSQLKKGPAGTDIHQPTHRRDRPSIRTSKCVHRTSHQGLGGRSLQPSVKHSCEEAHPQPASAYAPLWGSGNFHSERHGRSTAAPLLTNSYAVRLIKLVLFRSEHLSSGWESVASPSSPSGGRLIVGRPHCRPPIYCFIKCWLQMQAGELK